MSRLLTSILFAVIGIGVALGAGLAVHSVDGKLTDVLLTTVLVGRILVLLEQAAVDALFEKNRGVKISR